MYLKSFFVRIVNFVFCMSFRVALCRAVYQTLARLSSEVRVFDVVHQLNITIHVCSVVDVDVVDVVDDVVVFVVAKFNTFA